MGLRSLLSLLALLMLGPITARAEATKPVVVATTPTMEAREVDPSLSEIVVRFDRPMAPGSWSWCGGGEHYPELAGQPSYRDDRTAVLPVKLKPERMYFININCPSAQGFRSTEGQAVEPTLLRFTTSCGDEMVMARGDNYKSWQEFRRLFRERYSYYERTGTDWESVFDDAEGWVLRSPTTEEWLLRVSILLAPAEDAHLYLRDPGGKRYSTYRRHAEYNGNIEDLKRQLPNLQEHNNIVWSATKGRVGYLAVHAWNNDNQQLEIIAHIMKEMCEETDALIVDVRGNGGGVETDARAMAGWFLQEDSHYAGHRNRDPESPTGWTDVRERWVRANPPERRYEGQVFVLQGPVCLSSNEAFLLMMRQAPRAVSIGATSGGSSANPRSWPLPNGTMVVLPRWQTLTPDGSPWEGVGIAPDVEVDGDFRVKDIVLARALEMAETAIAKSDDKLDE
ncbi:hypothetical protein KQI84_03425 [bacterium]|nr:hypothetical protein [bacterium]